MLTKREEQIQSLSEVDVVVIGGGATGLGIGVDSATRGYKTLLLEKNDYAKATSSRSTKILHGGVRYLVQGNIKLVREALTEKLRLYDNAPQVARTMNFTIPSTNVISKMYYRLGMFLYDILAGFHKEYLSYSHNQQSMIANLKNIKYHYLRGGVIYNDGQFDDARTAVTLMRTLEDKGGVAINYAEVISIDKEKDKIVGVTFINKLNKKRVSIKAKCIFNATGIYSDSVMNLDLTSHESMVNLSKGIHLVVDKEVYPNSNAMLIPKTTDGRVLFFIPWYNKTIIGTTDVHVNEVLDDPIPSKEEIDLIIQNANIYLDKPISKKNITSIYAGIRPLMQAKSGESTSKVSREDHVGISASGLISIVGGKWTTYRHMAEKSIDLAITHKKLSAKKCKTHNLKLHGYVSKVNAQKIPYNYRFYGTEYEVVKNLTGFKNILHTDLPICEAQVRYAVEYEQAFSVDDVLARRTRCLFLNAQASIDIAEQVANIMQGILKTNDQWKKEQVEEFKNIAKKYLISSYM